MVHSFCCRPGCCGAYVSPERTDPDAKLEPANASVRATADSSETQGQTTVIMSGDVQLTQGYRSLNADKAVFNQTTREAEITGDIQIREPGLLLHAEQAQMHIDSGDATLKCARCLTEFRGPVALDLCELYTTPGHELPDDEAYRVQGSEIDLEPMLRDALVLALPLNPVCREACRGLCARCGRDLNDGDCDCEESEIDPRWADLAALREKLNG